jgi:predicted transcriptional regulator
MKPYGGEPGLLTPSWWDIQRSQYGLLKKWKIDGAGAYIDSRQVSGVTVDRLGVHDAPAFSLRIKQTNNGKLPELPS